MTCTCGHDADTQHDGPCNECRCPGPTANPAPVVTWINGRWPVSMPPHRAYRREWPWWEAARLATMAHYLRRGDVVYDVGAEEGELPALWATWGCEVVMVEPNPRVWPNIRTVWEANMLKPLAWFVGFADAEGAEEPRTAAPWPECAYGPVIHDHGFLTLHEYPSVPRTTIDAMAAASIPPTAITIDVEGAELKVLRGAEQTLRTHRPKVFVSVHPEFMWQYGDNTDLLTDFMEDCGYRPQYLATDHEEHWLWLPKEVRW